MDNVKPPAGIDKREVRCLKCGAMFWLQHEHICMTPPPETPTPRTKAFRFAFGNRELTPRENEMAEWYEKLERELAEANAKLAKLSRIVDIAAKANDAQSENEVALSATFAEAMAWQGLEEVERDRDRWRKMAEELADELAWRFKSDPHGTPISGAAIVLSRFNAMQKENKP